MRVAAADVRLRSALVARVMMDAALPDLQVSPPCPKEGPTMSVVIKNRPKKGVLEETLNGHRHACGSALPPS